MKHEINIKRVEKSRINEVDFNNLTFGKEFSDHMFIADYKNGAWSNYRIEPMQHMLFHPATSAFHYGQAIFEGLKAQKDQEGTILVFRPDMNAKRMDISAERMGMPTLPEGLFLQAIQNLLEIDSQWVPTTENSSLYIRPFMIATDEYVGIRESENYKFIIFTCPVGPYYSAPVSVYISEEYIRAFPGGVGYAKCAGNYGASLYPLRNAKKEGYDQILWLDGIEKKYFQECGTMNVFLQIDNVLITPPLDEGTILAGITRDSVITLAREMGIEVKEQPISVDDFIKAHAENRIQDAFGAGTAATIAPIKSIGYRDKKYNLPDVTQRNVSNTIKQMMNEIKNGTRADTHHWLMHIVADIHAV